MKTDLRRIALSGWHLLTEVPGWPDAPLGQRFRRALPVLVPASIALLLLAVQMGYHQPRLNALRYEHQPLLDLEDEVAQLQLAYSAQQVEDLKQATEDLRRQLPQDLREIRETLQGLEQEALARGWVLTYRLVDPPTEESSRTDTSYLLVPVRARLVPAETNEAPLVSLLRLLEKITTAPRRIDLMRLAISADEGQWQGVELGLRLAMPSSHAQVPQ